MLTGIFYFDCHVLAIRLMRAWRPKRKRGSDKTNQEIRLYDQVFAYMKWAQGAVRYEKSEGI